MTPSPGGRSNVLGIAAHRRSATSGSMPDSTLVGVLLFAMFEGGGNVPLITPVVAAMVERGHDVAVLAGPNIRRPAVGLPSDRFYDRLRGTGARVVPLLDEPVDPLDGYTPRAAILGRTPDSLYGAIDVGAHGPLVDTVGDPSCDGARRAPTAAPRERLLLVWCTGRRRARWRANGGVGPQQQRQLAIAAASAATAWAAADAWPGWSVARPSVGRQLQACRSTRRAPIHQRRPRRARVEPASPPTRASGGRRRVLVMGSRAFDLPLRLPLPGNLRHIGAIRTTAPDQSWRPADNDGDHPLVLVSLSTLPQGQAPIMRRILETLHDIPVRAVVTLGPALANETFAIPAGRGASQSAFWARTLSDSRISAPRSPCENFRAQIGVGATYSAICARAPPTTGSPRSRHHRRSAHPRVR